MIPPAEPVPSTSAPAKPAPTVILTALEADALNLAKRHGNKLIRTPSSGWTYNGCPTVKPESPVPTITVSTAAVMALVQKRVMRITELRRGLPVKVEVRP